jgi:PQQ-dependent dehydrogenase (methanol/ethanol family)
LRHWLPATLFIGCVSVLAIGAQERRVDPVDDAALRRAAASGEWLTYGLTQAETRYSPLTEINSGNVTRLSLAWSEEIGFGGGRQEATPLVWNGTIYVISNYSVVFARDALTGKERWHWDPQVNPAAVRPELCCGVVNRGLALYQGLIIAPIVDGRLEALDAESGKVVWESRVAFPQDHYTITMAPRMARGKVIVGVSGGEFPTRGFFDAYDAMTGRRVWRFYTVPGDPSKPFENAAMKKAAETWDEEWWKRGGGGSVWDGIAYDDDLDLLYVGTGNAEPWPRQFRSSMGKDNLFVCSILAVRAATGELKWHYQVVPGDSWDYDSVQQLTLTTLMIDGRPRKVVMQANKNGFFYVLDRTTGQLISADPFARVTWASGIDLKTGRPTVNPAAYYGTEGVALSPGPGGAHNWAPMSFNPMTGLVYIPATTTSSASFAAQPTYEVQPARQDGFTGMAFPAKQATQPSPPAIGPDPLESGGGRALVAWDPIARQIRWRATGSGPTLTTAGNLVIETFNNGRLLAYSADRGEKLLDIDTGVANGLGPPITYRLGGRQYIAFAGGIGRAAALLAGSPFVAADTPPPRLLTFSLDGSR